MSKSLSKDQLQKYIDTLPEYPKGNTFTRKERIRIASMPTRFKTFVDEMLVLYKCAKFNECKK